MSTLKEAIFSEVRLQHEQSALMSDDELEKLMFHHKGGQRLAFPGFLILKNIFTVYSFEIPCTLTAKHQIGMEKMEYPYFLTARRLVLFSEMDAMMVKLQGGIQGFLETCYNMDR